MKSHRGFVIPLILGIIALLAIGGGVYFYFHNAQNQKISNLNITNPDDVVDFDTCMSYAKNTPTSFDIVFAHGSNLQEVKSFEADFQTAYPRSKLTISTEQDYYNRAIAENGQGLKSVNITEDYKNMITNQAYSEISVNVPLIDLGSKTGFNNFISSTLKKYPNLKFQQYSGSSPNDSLSDSGGTTQKMQRYYENQCVNKYKTQNASERATADLKATDEAIELGVRGAILVNASRYYEDHGYYANGPLSLNSGVCSDTGPYGLRQTLEAISKNGGSVYCYASSQELAVSAPLKSDPSIGYCADNSTFSGTTSSPTAASKGYCISQKQVIQDISSCKNAGATARERWICVGRLVDPQLKIVLITGPFATPVTQKIDYCKKFTGIEADYCFTSIVKAGWGLNVKDSPDASAVCNMVSNTNPWFKTDCLLKD